MSILFIRHGETPLNIARVLQPADTPLSDTGRAQAEALARRLKPLQITQILSSDLPRARQTAEAIATATGAPVELSPLLQERNFGDLRGRAYDSLGFDPLAMADAPPNGESAAQFRARVAEAFADVVRRRGAAGGTLAVVTHGLVIHRMVEHHVRLGEGHVVPVRIANTSVTVVGAEAPHLVDLLDCTRHLAGAAADDPASLSGG